MCGTAQKRKKKSWFVKWIAVLDNSWIETNEMNYILIVIAALVVVASSQPDSTTPNGVSASEKNKILGDDEAAVDVKSGNLPSKGNSISQKSKHKHYKETS